MGKFDDLFREWREDYAAREAEEKRRREGQQPDQQPKPPEKKERDQDRYRGR
jgi:hypothetical protein